MKGQKGCDDQDQKVTWLSFTDKVLEKASQNIPTVYDQDADSLKRNTSNALEQRTSSNQTTIAHAVAEVEQRPKTPSQERNKANVATTHQAQYDGPRPDMPMNVQSDNVDIIASNSERGSLIEPGIDALHSAQPLDADHVCYLRLCSRMSGIALSEFYAQLTANNFRQAEEDVLLFRRVMGFDAAFRWNGA